MNTSNNFLSKHWVLIVLVVIVLFLLYKFNSTHESFQYYIPNQNTCSNINNYTYYAPNGVCKAEYDTSNTCIEEDIRTNSQYFGNNSDIVDGEIQFDLDSCTLDKGYLRSYKQFKSDFTCST